MKTKKNSYNKGRFDLLLLLPILFTVAIIPLIVYMKIEYITNENIKYFWSQGPLVDMYSYYKSEFFIITAIVGSIIFFIRGKEICSEDKVKRYYIFMAIYIVCVLLSTLLSKNVTMSLFGFVGRYEGMFVLISYIIIMFLSINIINSEKYIKYVLTALIISAAVIGIIGVFQYFDYDFMRSSFFNALTIPERYRKYTLNRPVPLGYIYSTLAHYNYVGSYVALVFPVSFVLFIYIKKLKYKVVLGLFNLLMIINLFGSRSRAGLIGVFAAFVFFIVLSRHYLKDLLKRRWKYILAGIVLVVALLAGFDKIGGGKISSRIESLYLDIKGVASETVNNGGLIDIKIDGNEISFLFVDKQLNIFNNDYKLSYKDKDNKEVPVLQNGNDIKFSNADFKDVVLETSLSNGVNLLKVQINGNSILFALLNDSFKLVNHNGNLVDIRPVEKFGFSGKESIGSARGYIWSRSLPLLKDTVLIGYGPDTFSLHFPQDDYIGKFISYGTVKMYVDKVHNMFLGTAINTGVISFMALMIIFMLYTISSIKLYFKSEFKDFYSVVGLAIFTGFIGYIGAGLFNDSVVQVASVFWVLLGMGVSINQRILGMQNKIEETSDKVTNNSIKNKSSKKT